HFAELKSFLSTPRKIFITTHSKPDGDALGSSLAMYHYLLKKGHEPIVVSPSDYGMYLHWMPGNASVLCLPGDKERANKFLKVLTYSVSGTRMPVRRLNWFIL